VVRTTDLGEPWTNLRMRLSVAAEEVVSLVRNRCPCLVSVEVSILMVVTGKPRCFHLHDSPW